MEISYASPADIPAIAELEALSFPAAEAADEDRIRGRATAYPTCFWLLKDGDRLVSFVNGPMVDAADLTDEMYGDPNMHKPDGRWQMIFSVVTHPDLRRQGLASRVLRAACADAKARGCLGVVLTCKPEKLHFYGSLGFRDEGVSESEHGGALWHQMRLTF